jgi:ariadne-1
MSCDICYETFTARDCFGLGCNHRFCRDCWHPYLSLKIQSGADCIYTTCPMLKCNEVVNELVFREIIGEEEAKLCV